jgi:membrane associated rhomboid family serine protease
MFSFLIKLIDSVVWPALLVVSIWIVFFINLRYQLDLNSYGLHPQKWDDLYGVVTMIFLHGNFDHLLSNSIPLLLSMGFIFINFSEERASIIISNILATGIILFFIGQPGSNHIGASGLVYALIFFVVTHSFFTRNKEMLSASFTLIFLYGSLIYGLFPEFGKLIGKNISWEGHLSGALSGIIFGVLYRNRGPQKPPPLDDDFDDFEDEYWNTTDVDDQESFNTHIQYIYKKKD